MADSKKSKKVTKTEENGASGPAAALPLPLIPEDVLIVRQAVQQLATLHSMLGQQKERAHREEMNLLAQLERMRSGLEKQVKDASKNYGLPEDETAWVLNLDNMQFEARR